jgi:hypothetical protein
VKALKNRLISFSSIKDLSRFAGTTGANRENWI